MSYMGRIVSKECIRDATFKPLGWLETDEEGNQRLSDFSFKVLGWWNVKDKVTYTLDHRVVSRGANILMSLLR